ncbi:TetR/AcrR family transcriptional regulator [Mycoplasmatota bacterium]|nr:TetR/AcrR family transcriptional regulator [Mycoplasmatota bacterium]
MIDKKTKLVEAAMAEFVERGYEKASTISIVKRAGISKGLLFHHFGNKEKLFIHIYDYVMSILETKFIDKLEFKSNDILERLYEIIVLKTQLSMDYPLMFEFIAKAYYSAPESIYNEVIAHRDKLSVEVYQQLYTGIDKSLFKDEENYMEILKIINFSLEGIGKEYLEIARSNDIDFDFDEVKSMFNKYIDIFRRAFYKEEKND